jgi:hypothetical protein
MRFSTRSALAGLALAGTSLSIAPTRAGAAPAEPASCVAHASASFGDLGVRDDVAHAIKERFGIPPGAEVSRFAHVFLGSAAPCIENGQG